MTTVLDEDVFGRAGWTLETFPDVGIDGVGRVWPSGPPGPGAELLELAHETFGDVRRAQVRALQRLARVAQDTMPSSLPAVDPASRRWTFREQGQLPIMGDALQETGDVSFREVTHLIG